MKKDRNISAALPVLFGFFIMGFCDIVGITSDFVQRSFGWSSAMTGFVPSMVFIWFLLLGIPVGNAMARWGRKNTVMVSMAVTIVGMALPLVDYNSFTCIAAYAMLGIGNTILQVSLNPLLGNAVPDSRLLTSGLTAGQVIKALSSLAGPEIVLLAVRWFGEDRWYLCFPLLGAVTVVSALWLGVTHIPREDRGNAGLSVAGTFSLLKDRTIMLLFLGILFVVGVDVATNFMGSKIMSARFGWEVEKAKLAPQVYFFSRTVGALLGAVLLARVNEVKYFRLNTVACAASSVALMLVSDPVSDMILIGAVGFFASSVFSIIYSMALRERPADADSISGLMITAIAGGGAVTPVIGAVLDSPLGIGGGIAVMVVCVGYLVFCAFGIPQSKMSK